MKTYIKTVENVLEARIDFEKNFNLIKLENFTAPIIYLEVCKRMSDLCKERNIHFIGKMNISKFNIWALEEKYADTLNEIKLNKWVDENEPLTKWRNAAASNKSTKTLVLLMGTEEVEDKGSLAEFNTIDPEIIEDVVDQNYCAKLANANYSDSTEEIINNIYKNIFKYTQVDLVKISDFFEEYSSADELDIPNIILSTMYEWWKIPNIMNGVSIIAHKTLSSKKIDLIEKGYKFSRRIGIDSYQKDVAITKLENQIDEFLTTSGELSEYDISDFGDYATNLIQLKNDLIDYLKGKNIQNVKEKLLSINFIIINKLLKIKKGTKTQSNKPVKIKGDPLKVLTLPVLYGISDMEEQEKEYLSSVKIKINKITLANTISEIDDEDIDKHSIVITKWYRFVYFLQDIEGLIKKHCICNLKDEEVNFDIVFEDKEGIEKYPFDIEVTKSLDESGILKGAKDSESNSKILFDIEFSGEKLKTIRNMYEWTISNEESWTHAFNIYNDIKFNALIQNDSLFIPTGYSKDVDSLINSKDEEEFFYFINTLQFNYSNILEKIDKNDELYFETVKLAKSFVDLIMSIRNKGLFGTLNSSNLITEFLKVYKNHTDYATNILKKTKRENKSLNILSKSFVISNTEEIYGKNINGAIIPIYHPVMLEKVIERYNYLSEAFKEIYYHILREQGLSKKAIKKSFDRFDQLSTVTFSTSVLLGENNKLIPCKKSYGFYNVYGEQANKNSIISNVAMYGDIDYEEDEKLVYENSPISNYISSSIKEYLNTYPSKIDGFTIAFVRPNNYGEIISGLNSILKKLKNEVDHNIKIRLVIYSDDFRGVGAKYFSNWIDSNFSEEDNVLLESTIKLLKYDSIDKSRIESYLDKTLEYSDLVFFNEIMRIKDIETEYVDSLDIPKTENRFPSVYLPVECYEESYRKLNITQEQFTCEYSHAQHMVYLKDPNASEAKYRIIKKVGLGDEDKLIIEKLHEKSTWVIILDENIDIDLLKSERNKIIGFTTGAGYFGELNTTISSKDSIIKDLKDFMKKRLRNKFAWSSKEIEIAAQKCIDMTKELDGADILRALNPDDESINSYLAHLMTSQSISNEKVEDGTIIRTLISLDSYKHLFDEGTLVKTFDGQSSRPDLLLLELKYDETDKKYIVNAKIIECKLAQYNVMHIDKAQSQVEQGSEYIRNIWNPKSDSVQKRFWLNQLYRILIFSKKNLNEAIDLNAICEGEFIININKEIYLYWIDEDYEEVKVLLSGESSDIKERHFSMRQIRKYLIGTENIDTACEYEEEKPPTTEIPKVAEGGIGENGTDVNDNIEYEKKDNKSKGKDSSDITKNNDKEPITIDEEVISDIDGKLVSPDVIEMFKPTQKMENEEDEVNYKFSQLRSFLQYKKVNIRPKESIVGPDVIRYCFNLDFKNSFKDVTKYDKDIQLTLGLNQSPYIFIEDGLIKMDTARSKRQMVGLKTMYSKLNEAYEKYKDYKEHLYVLIGSDVLGEPFALDLSDANSPHLLIAGQTGSGKSVLLSSILVSIMALYRPEEVEMVLIDPKRIELTAFRDTPYTKEVATEIDHAIKLLSNLVDEMDRRYRVLEQAEVKNIVEYNYKYPSNKMKRIIMVFDEYADMMQADKKYADIIENSISRLSALARASGIHLIICTQSPKAEIITTKIRNNLSARIGLKVADSNASNVILDESGAESLFGKGDMLVKSPEFPQLKRIKSPYVSTEEIQEFIRSLK